MTRDRKLSLFERSVIGLVDVMTRLAYGYRTPLAEEAVRSMGVSGYLRWAKGIARTLDALTRRYGAVDAQFVIGFAGLWIGCGFCGVGHIFAGNLLLFRDHGVLSPLDNAVLRDLYETRDDEALDKIRGLLDDPRYERLRGLIERQYALRGGAPTNSTEDDDYMLAALAAWDWMTECSIANGLDVPPEEVPPLDVVARDRQLRDRYEAARRGG